MPLDDIMGKIFNNIFITNTDAKSHGCTVLSYTDISYRLRTKHNLKKTATLGAKLI